MLVPDNRSQLFHDPGDLRNVYNWIDDRFGPIRRLSGFPLVPPEPRWWVYTCELARSPAGTFYSPSHFGSSGSSINPNEALQRALGEAVERYCGMNAKGILEEILLAPAETELAPRFPVCARDEPCPETFKELSRVNRALPHVMMYNLSDGGQAPIPAAYVHLSLSQGNETPLVTLPISTGLAFHHDRHLAIWSGLCEVAERDAMMQLWWTQKHPCEIVCDEYDLPNHVASRLERLRSVGLTGRLFDITTDFLVPTVFCVITSHRYPYFTAGASCHSDPAIACCKSIDEATAVRVSARWDKWSNDIPSYTEFSWVRLIEHHMALYAKWENSPALDFLLRQEHNVVPYSEFCDRVWLQLPTSMDDLAVVATKLESIGLTALWTDMTTPEAIEFGRVTKVVVPEMVPLSQDHNARWLATPRLMRAAGAVDSSRVSFNPFPHPFA